LDGQSIGYAEIDLGFKFNGNAVLQLKKGGALVDTVTVPCSSASDCGPDSGGGDNRRVILWLDAADDPGAGAWYEEQIAGTFDTIVIKPGSSSSKGVVSLEGGSNGAPAGPVGSSLGTTDTLFILVQPFDGEIDCGETEPLDEGGDATTEITRGFDTSGECKGPADGLLFNFESGMEGDELFVDFITEPVDGDTLAQFLEVITWNFGSPPDVINGDDQHKTLSYERVGDGLPGGSGVTVDPSDFLPTGHTSCLIESSSKVTITGAFVAVDVVYNVAYCKRWR
jgi:hypothetical protein